MASVASRLLSSRALTLIGAPLSLGQSHRGVARAPGLLRAAGLTREVTALGWAVNDAGDLLFQAGEGVASSDVACATSAICDAVQSAAAANTFPLLIGGDHSVALGSVAGLLRARPETRILWVDAHADINTPASSLSGNFHGMPLSLLCRLVEPSALGPEWAWLTADTPALAPERVVYVGLRDLDAPERALIKRLGMTAFTMADVDRNGISAVMDCAIKALTAGPGGGDAPLHLSFDIDACDPTVAPHTGTAVLGGLSYREAHFVCEAMCATGALCSMDLVEVNADLGGGGGSKWGDAGDSMRSGSRRGARARAVALSAERPSNATVDAAVAFITSALGKTIL